MSRLHHTKSMLTLCLCASLAGCFGSDDDDETPTPNPEPVNAALSGAASKGIIIGGTVTAYEIVDGVVTDTVLGTATTGDDGTYSINIEGGEAKLFKVVISVPTGGASMKCDMPDGCDVDGDGNIDVDTESFGKVIPLPADFTLSAIASLAADATSISTNVTVLTQAAASIAEANGLTPEAATNANSQVAALFNISSGDVTNVPVIDLTDADSVNGASEADLKAALTSVAVANAAATVAATQAGTNGNNLANIIAGVNSFAQTMAANNGQIVANDADGDNTTVSLSDVLGQVSNVALTVATQTLALTPEQFESQAPASLVAVQQQATQQQQVVELLDEGEQTNAGPSDEINSDNMAKVKAMVADVRNLEVSLQPITEAFDGTSTSEGFASQLELASRVLDNDSMLVFDAITQAGLAFTEAFEDYNGQTSLPAAAYNFSASNGLTVAMTPGASLNAAVASINQVTVGEVTLDMTADLNATFDEQTTETDNSGEGAATGDVDIMISGTAMDRLVTVTLTELSLEAEFNDQWQWSWTNSQSDTGYSSSNTDSGTFMGDICLHGEIMIAHNSGVVESPASFEGEIMLAVTDLVETYDDSYSNEGTFNPDGTGSYSYMQSFSSSLKVSSLDIMLAGKFTLGSNDLSAVLMGSASAPEGTTITFEEMSSYDGFENSSGEFGQSYESSSTNNETAEAYMAVELSLAFIANLPGIDDQTSLAFSLERSGLEDVMAHIDATWTGNDYDISMDSAQKMVTVTNLDGVMLTMQEDENEVISGHISLEGEQYATVEETSNGAVIIRYTDGEFESF